MLKKIFGSYIKQQYIIVIFCILSTLLVGWALQNKDHDSYKSGINQAKIDADRFIKVFSEYVELHVSTVNMLLQQSERYLKYVGFPNNIDKNTDQIFYQWLDQISYVTSLFYADYNGKIHFISQEKNFANWFHQDSSIAHKNFFLSHQHDSQNILKLHSPSTPEIIVDDIVVVSRRINNPDGSFAGVIGATVHTSFLENLFHALGKNTKIALIIENKKLFTFGHNKNIDIFAFSKILNHVKYLDNNQNNIIINTFNDSVSQQNLTHVFAYKKFFSIPLNLLLILNDKDILSDWRNDHNFYITFFALYFLIVTMIAVYTIIMANHIKKSENSEKTAIMANQAKSDFLAKMSHELRTPLNAIIGFSEMMEAEYFGKINDKQKERTRDINMCGNHLLELINDILEFSKGEAGKLSLLEEIISPAHIIQQAIRIASQRAKIDDIKIITNYSQDLPMLKADKRKLKQILINLLTNSVKFSQIHGKVYINAYVDKSNQFIFVVRDNGIGIAKKDIPKALSVFGQVHKTMEAGGTGLGLPLCKMFAELHGGTLRLDSIEGKGTRVAIKLPSYRIVATKNSKHVPNINENDINIPLELKEVA